MKWSRYWIFQLLGWFLFAFLNIYISLFTGQISVSNTTLNLSLLVLGLILSHSYRTVIIQKEWLRQETEKLLLYVFLGTALLSLTYTLSFYLLRYFIVRPTNLHLKFADMMGAYVAVFFLFGIWNAIYFSWNYIERNRQLLISRLRVESDLKDLEIKTIKANLQPHFIFNALNSIRALIDENPKLAREAVTKISNILRSSITQKKELDTLANEIQLVEDYLDLEKIRFEERLQFSKKIDPQSLHILIPTMMLQTLVENAIKHGISASEYGGEIILETYIQQGTISIILRNTGTLLKEKQHEDSLSFGLNATKQRLAYFYKDQAHFSIEQENQFVNTSIIIHHQEQNTA
jgi:two-component system, LytTR family, sensor kinase